MAVEVCVIVLGPLAERSAFFSLVASTGNGTASRKFVEESLYLLPWIVVDKCYYKPMFIYCTAGLDFVQLTETLLPIDAGQRRKCANVPILEDTVIEATEWFEVTLNTVERAIGSAVVFITDNDGE